MEHRLKLVLTCAACPEQYDAYLGGVKIGYLRLRHGFFTVDYLPGEYQVFSGCPHGDGRFLENERVAWLNRACRALLAVHESPGGPWDTEPIYDRQCECEDF